MSTGDLHQISVAIGALQAKAEESGRDVEAIFQQIREINQKLAPLPALVADVAALKPKVEAHERLKNRGLGFLFGISGTSSIGAVGLWEGLRALFSFKTGG